MRKSTALSLSFSLAFVAALLLAWHQSKVPTSVGMARSSSFLPSGASSQQRSYAAKLDGGPIRPAASSFLQSRATKPSASRMLAAESRFFTNGKLSLPALQETMTGSRFASQVTALEQQSAVDESASALTRAYDEAVLDQLRTAGLDRGQRQVACGLSLCLGTLTSDSNNTLYERWWTEFEHSPNTPHTIGVDYTIDLGGGLYEHRFAFVTDPSIKDYRARVGR